MDRLCTVQRSRGRDCKYYPSICRILDSSSEGSCMVECFPLRGNPLGLLQTTAFVRRLLWASEACRRLPRHVRQQRPRDRRSECHHLDGGAARVLHADRVYATRVLQWGVSPSGDVGVFRRHPHGHVQLLERSLRPKQCHMLRSPPTLPALAPSGIAAARCTIDTENVELRILRSSGHCRLRYRPSVCILILPWLSDIAQAFLGDFARRHKYAVL
mmetsp:Transcript_71522/g.205183  ORF Transcript_71522/g.205183 Transcript_71522/m.205183 type:complete len:215 (-) Transcript_71522:29-673(-)